MIIYCIELDPYSSLENDDHYYWFATKKEALAAFKKWGKEFNWEHYCDKAQPVYPAYPFMELWRVEIPKQSPKKMVVEAAKYSTWPALYGKVILTYRCIVDEESETLKKFIEGGA